VLEGPGVEKKDSVSTAREGKETYAAADQMERGELPFFGKKKKSKVLYSPAYRR